MKKRDPCPHGGHGGYDPVVRVPERDHNKLENRDEANQHPIDAISGLQKELDEKVGSKDTLSILDIEEILSL